MRIVLTGFARKPLLISLAHKLMNNELKFPSSPISCGLQIRAHSFPSGQRELANSCSGSAVTYWLTSAVIFSSLRHSLIVAAEINILFTFFVLRLFI